MIKLTMIRHGKTAGNLQGRYVGKTDEGILESEKEKFSAHQMGFIDRLYTSPMLRCVETADILYPSYKKNIVPEFREIDFGTFEYRTYKELSGEPAYQEWIESGGTTTFPEGESLSSFHARIRKGMERICTDALTNGYQNIAMVVHGGTIMSILSRYGIPKKGYYDWQVKNGEGYVIRFTPEAFLAGERDMVVDEHIVL
ncbi:MAG TPA: histidine phosphatase family protein [Lachnospiraceae bacterium]|nr:histidine phosphatase family protein [Lachnospiraceae bacterium]